MKQIIVIAILALSFQGTHAQSDLAKFNQERIKITKQGLLTLGGWSVANMIGGGIGMATSGGEAFYFHRMNLAWNAVNFGIAVPALIMLHREKSITTTDESWKKFRQAEASYTFNTALDLAYITAGFWFRDRANNPSADAAMMRGFGNSFILQGGFLLVYDAFTLVRLNMLHKKRWQPLIQKIDLRAGGLGLKLTYYI